MKIGIIAPSPVPFTVGGAEKFYWGLQEYINKNTAHQCELVKVPVKEDNFWNLIDSYHKFYSLDVSYFDAVITSKYPAWMINHPNHHIYMLHCLRGLYDTYDPARFFAVFNSLQMPSKVKGILNYIEDYFGNPYKSRSSLNGLFRMLFELRNENENGRCGGRHDMRAGEIYAFPGEFIRKIIHFFDKRAMENVKSFSAISKTVAGRKEYFPGGSKINVIYPSSNLTGFKNESYKYFFTVSRLDGAKRVRMIIEAYLEAGVNIPLKIAGTGPSEQELKELSKNDSRIEFLGFIGDKELVDYYANALAVIFIPYEEDYGLVAVEAMMSEKAVITLADSGGVKEFVENAETGFICEPSVKSLKAAMEKAGKDIEYTARMGLRAKKAVENINWENAFNALNPFLNRSAPVKAAKTTGSKAGVSRKKITLATTYPVYPPRGGGQNRIFYLYKELANYFDVELITLAGENDAGFRKEIAPNLIENRIPKSKEFADKEYRQLQKKIGIPATDIAMLYFYGDLKDYEKAAEKSAGNADFLIASHPYSYYVLNKLKSPFLIYESHNVEYELKKQMVSGGCESEKVLSYLFEAEKEACLKSDLTTVCAMEDACKMQKLYGLDLNRAIKVPNGVDLETVKFFPLEKREEIKSKLGLGREKIIFFMGSWHQPNIDAAEKIIDAAKKLAGYKFIILGSVGTYFKNNKISYPHNVGFAGVVDDCEKELYLSIADLAINPMAGGSGTNLKMLDYMAAGIPVLSTVVGARGLELVQKTGLNCPDFALGAGGTCDNPDNGLKSYFINLASMEDFSGSIINAVENYEKDKIFRAREYVEANFDWKIIAENFKNTLTKMV